VTDAKDVAIEDIQTLSVTHLQVVSGVPMPVTILDMIVIGAVLISALLAALRGFTREVLAIGSWAAAAVVAYLFHPMVTPLVQQYVTTNKSLILPVAAGSIFLLTLLVAYVLTSKISDMILDSRIGALDRSLGFLFGAARGLLLAVVGFLFFNWLVSDKQQPSWVKDAKLKPLLESTGATLMGFLPDDPDKAILQRVRPKPADGDTPRETTPEPQKRSEAPAVRAPAPAAQSPTPADRAALNRLVDGGQKPTQQR
jgi:membrane protein required for colicin V production